MQSRVHAATQLERAEKERERQKLTRRKTLFQSLSLSFAVHSRSVEVHGQALVFCYGHHVGRVVREVRESRPGQKANPQHGWLSRLL